MWFVFKKTVMHASDKGKVGPKSELEQQRFKILRENIAVRNPFSFLFWDGMPSGRVIPFYLDHNHT